MTNRHEFTVTFVTPDEVKEENVLFVLQEYFGDLVQTDRFIDASVEKGSDLDDSEEKRLREMLSDISEEEFEDVAAFMEELDG